MFEDKEFARDGNDTKVSFVSLDHFSAPLPKRVTSKSLFPTKTISHRPRT
jgi:hypothetical protein